MSVMMNKDKEEVQNRWVTVGDDSVTIIVQKSTFYRVIRTVNHWIEQLMKLHQGNDGIDVSKTDNWYCKWRARYKIMRSSRRDFKEIYQQWTNDFTEENPTPLLLWNHLIADIPHLENHYERKEMVNKDTNSMKFSLTIELYKFKDNNNRFGKAASVQSYDPFNGNSSIVTFNTIASCATGNFEDNEQDHIEADKDNSNDNVPMPNINLHQDLSAEKKPTPTSFQLSSDLSIGDDSKLSKKDKQNRKSTELQKVVAQACTTTINEIGKNMQSYVENLNSTMQQQTELLKQLTIAQTTIKVEPKSTTPRHTVDPSFRYTHIPSPRVKVPAPNNASTPTSHPSNHNKTLPTLQRPGVTIFMHRGDQYELNDTHFHKYTRDLMKVTTKVDLIQYYMQLQAMAANNNIFMMPFDRLTTWDKAADTIPPTCMLESLTVEDNTVEAYRKMTTSLYTKISESKFNNLQYQAIVHHHATTQDGFETLYDLAAQCHPKIIAKTSRVRDTNVRPTMTSQDSIFTYTTKLQTWIDIDAINGVKRTDSQIIDIVLEELYKDSRFELACAGIVSQIRMNETFNRQYNTTTFPVELKLSNLPHTIMAYYSEDEQSQLYPQTTPTINTVSTPTRSNTTTDQVCQDIIRKLHSNKSLSREFIDEVCKGCGKYGHEVYQSGCDFCAQYLIAKNYLEEHPTAATPILKKYRKHQQLRRDNRQSKLSTKSEDKKSNVRFKKYNTRNATRSTKAKVKQLTDLIESIYESEQSDSDDSHYKDANSDESGSESQENN